jgi:hypothetical protein
MTGRASVAAAESVIGLVRGAVVGAESATVAENMTGLLSVAESATVAENMTGLLSVAEKVNCIVISHVIIF